MVELLDLKVDRDRLLGRAVTTSGRLSAQGQLTLLITRSSDNTPLHVIISRLTGERQKEVRSSCTPSCAAVVKGKVVHVDFGIGLAAEAISVQATAR